MTQTVAAPVGFQLTPPEVVQPISNEVAKTAIPLPPELT